MSDELHRELNWLEANYPEQPPIVQQADLVEINRLRTALGLPLVDGELREHGATVVDSSAEARIDPPAEVADSTGDVHAEARELYGRYLERESELERHRAYADEVSRATHGRGMTPVRPLATMGTNGGPLLCDHCGKAILLEGEPFHGVTADVAWRRSSGRDWASWILGGMVVERQTNGTLRIYHGYPHVPDACCTLARNADDREREAHEPASGRMHAWSVLTAMLSAERPELNERDRDRHVDAVLTTLFDYDPGIGVNRPG